MKPAPLNPTTSIISYAFTAYGALVEGRAVLRVTQRNAAFAYETAWVHPCQQL